MIILSDLLDVVIDITELDVWAYSDWRLQKQWIFGDRAAEKETVHMYHSRKKGVIDIIPKRINAYGVAVNRVGQSEGRWGVMKELFPKGLLEAEVTKLSLSPQWQGDGQRCWVYVNIPLLTAQSVISEIKEMYKDCIIDADTPDPEETVSEK